MGYLLMGVSPTRFPVEVEGKGEVDRLGSLLNNLSESVLKNVPSLAVARLRPPSELPRGEGELTSLPVGDVLVRFFMVLSIIRKTFLKPMDVR